MNTCTLTLEQAAQAIAARESIFHQPELGTSRADFDALMAPEFREVGASGRKYSRGEVLNVLEARQAQAAQENFCVLDFVCQELAAGLYLATYHLTQANRVSRRASLWRHAGPEWKIVYHQGTLVEG